MCDSIDKNIPLMRPTFFGKDDENNPKNRKIQNINPKEEFDKQEELKPDTTNK